MNKKIFSLLIIVTAVILDHATKTFAMLCLKDTSLVSVDLINGVLSFTYHENRGAAFGMLANNRWVFMTVSIISIIAILAYLIFYKENSYTVLASLALIAGGGIGNMIDRIKLGYVIDFIYFELIDFPVFNIADICVTCGAALLILYLIFSKKGDLQGTT
ncbi:MAG: signal peptidase II [Ruminococcaceae bacterium]|nr:signal peptidase II [Oscillospiraceae bacterium]